MGDALVEEIAIEIFRRAKCDPAWPDGIGDLAMGYLGPNFVELVSATEVWGESELTMEHGAPLILVRRDLPIARRNFRIAFHVAEHFMDQSGAGLSSDAACSRVAAALLMPRAAFLRRVAEREDDVAAVAEDFRAQSSAAWWRLGETRGDGIAVLEGDTVRGVRGAPLPFDDLPRLARARIRPAHIRVEPIADQPDRVVIAAAA